MPAPPQIQVSGLFNLTAQRERLSKELQDPTVPHLPLVSLGSSSRVNYVEQPKRYSNWILTFGCWWTLIMPVAVDFINKLLLNLFLKLKSRRQSKQIFFFKKRRNERTNKQIKERNNTTLKKMFGANHGEDPSHMHLILGTSHIFVSTSLHFYFSWHDLCSLPSFEKINSIYCM